MQTREFAADQTVPHHRHAVAAIINPRLAIGNQGMIERGIWSHDSRHMVLFFTTARIAFRSSRQDVGRIFYD